MPALKSPSEIISSGFGRETPAERESCSCKNVLRRSRFERRRTEAVRVRTMALWHGEATNLSLLDFKLETGV